MQRVMTNEEANEWADDSIDFLLTYLKTRYGTPKMDQIVLALVKIEAEAALAAKQAPHYFVRSLVHSATAIVAEAKEPPSTVALEYIGRTLAAMEGVRYEKFVKDARKYARGRTVEEMETDVKDFMKGSN